VLSQPQVYSRLRDGFVAVRFDWEQGNHYKRKFGFILGTGDQMLLTPAGEPIAHDKPTKDGRPGVVYGRHGCDTTPAVLDAVLAGHPPKPTPVALKLDWFLWPRKPSAGRRGGVYPVPYEAAAGYARLPLAVVEGPLPGALRDPAFLRWHVRQFIWVRGREDGPSRVVLRRVKDGLRQGLSPDLATLGPDKLTPAELGGELDRAWLAYMRDRPLVARGYLDNPHGGWMRGVAAQMLDEEQAVRRRAAEGTLLPPGRTPGEPPPY
jgi:hypothetical protein